MNLKIIINKTKVNKNTTNKGMKTSSSYWTTNCKSILPGIRMNSATNKYYVRKSGKYVGTFSSRKSAIAAFKSAL